MNCNIKNSKVHEDLKETHRRERSYEEEKARSTLFQPPRIVDEWDEGGKHVIRVMVT